MAVAKSMGHVDTRMIETRYGHVETNLEYLDRGKTLKDNPFLPPVNGNGNGKVNGQWQWQGQRQGGCAPCRLPTARQSSTSRQRQRKGGKHNETRKKQNFLTQIAAGTDPLTALAAVPTNSKPSPAVCRSCLSAGRGLDYGGVTWCALTIIRDSGLLRVAL